MKTCKRCMKSKPHEAFHVYRKAKDGRQPICKECRSAERKQCYANNSERIKKVAANYRADNRTAILDKKQTFRNEHRGAIKDYRQTYDVVNARKIKDTTLRYKYGITLDECEQMLVAQNHACGICRRPLPDKRFPKREYIVDHDHKTGAVRGILCHKCNTSLGGFGDDPETLKAALSYLQGGST